MGIITIILLIIGFVLLIKGADFFVDGSSSIATRFGIPSIIIGLTIVSMGTSAPEAAVSITSSVAGSNALAVSNIIGSNIFNILIVIGATALLANVKIQRNVIKEDFPVLLIASFLLLIFSITDNTISRIEGIILLLGMIAYIYYLIRKIKSTKVPLENNSIKNLGLTKSILFILGGIICITVGGNLVVESATTIALSLGLSETLVGLTIVAIGTSLPELVTSITAAMDNNVDMAVGNAIGSNIFNILFILGVSDIIAPIKTSSTMIFDIVLMIVITIISYILGKDKLDYNKKDGIILICIFTIYMIFIIIRN
ncbi:MAG: calcium/sodium antiporter [Methanobacteriaceae archaeon]|nr:calcium/sodium antiporter [Methanobacteriaceae archaeon]